MRRLFPVAVGSVAFLGMLVLGACSSGPVSVSPSDDPSPGATSSDSGPSAVSAPFDSEPSLSRKQRREVAILYDRGLTAMENGQYDEALESWELAWERNPAHQNVVRFLTNEYLVRGLEIFAKGDLEGALKLWMKARRISPTDHRTNAYIAEAQAQMKRTEEIFE